MSTIDSQHVTQLWVPAWMPKVLFLLLSFFLFCLFFFRFCFLFFCRWNNEKYYSLHTFLCTCNYDMNWKTFIMFMCNSFCLFRCYTRLSIASYDISVMWVCVIIGLPPPAGRTCGQVEVGAVCNVAHRAFCANLCLWAAADVLGWFPLGIE